MRSQKRAHTCQLSSHIVVVLFLILCCASAYAAAALPAATCSLAQAVDTGSDSLLPTTHNKQRLIAEHANTWAHHFTFQAAVQLDSAPSAFAALRTRSGGGSSSSSSRSPPQLVALGDTSGRLYFFTPEGYLLYEHDSGVAAAVLAIQAAPLTTNTTLLAVGYGDGTLVLSRLTHQHATLMQTTPAIRSVVDTVISTPADREADYATRRTSKPAASRSRAATPAGGEASSTQQQAEQQQVSLTEGDGDDSSSKDNSTDTPKNASTSSSSSSQAEESGTQDLPAEEFEGTGPAATKHVQGAAVRHIRFVRTAGQQMVLLLEQRGVGWLLQRSNGRVRLRVDTPSDPLGLQASDHQAVVIHPQGITITWMRPGRSLIQARCRGLSPAEQGPVVAVAFDTVRKYKAYMLTASGELLTMVIPFGKQTHICRVMSKMVLGPPAGRVSLHTSHQRLLLVHSQGAAWLSLPPLLATAGALKPLVSSRWQQLWGLYGLAAAAGDAEVGGAGPGSDSGTAMPPDDAAGVLNSSHGVIAGGGGGSGGQGLELGGVEPAAEVQAADVATGRVLQGAAIEAGQEGSEPGADSSAAAAAAVPRQQWVLSAPEPHAFMGGTAGPMVLLPLGATSVALFSDGGVCGGSDSSGGGGRGGGSGRGMGGGDGEGFNWARLLQPVLVVMMIGVAVWQFMRASNKNRYAARDSMAGGFGRFDPTGFDQDPATARLRALADRFGPNGGGLDRDMLDRLDARLGRLDGRVGAAAAGGGGGGLRYREGAAAAAAARGPIGGRPSSNGAFRDLPEY